MTNVTAGEIKLNQLIILDSSTVLNCSTKGPVEGLNNKGSLKIMKRELDIVTS